MNSAQHFWWYISRKLLHETSNLHLFEGSPRQPPFKKRIQQKSIQKKGMQQSKLIKEENTATVHIQLQKVEKKKASIFPVWVIFQAEMVHFGRWDS